MTHFWRILYRGYSLSVICDALKVFNLLLVEPIRSLSGQTKIVSEINWGLEELSGLRQKTTGC